MNEQLRDNDNISIVNRAGVFRWGDMKDLVVSIGNQWYFKQDDMLVKVKNAEGKIRFFRRNSPLIKTLSDGTTVLKSNAIQTEDGLWFEKGSDNIVEINNKWVRKEYTFKYKGGNYLITDPGFVKEYSTGAFIKKEDGIIVLNPSLYGKEAYIKDSIQNRENLIDVGEKLGGFVFKRDAKRYLDSESGEIKYTINPPNDFYARGLEYSVFLEFQDYTNPQEQRINTVNATAKGFNSNNFALIDFTGGGGPRLYVHRTMAAEVEKAITNIIMPRYSQKLEGIVKKLNENYSDYDEHENTCKSFQIISQPFPGKQNIYTPNKTNPIAIVDEHGRASSRDDGHVITFEKTAGIKYSFGVEFETSQGLIPNDILNKISLKAVGDRSIGSAEYVTRPLIGDIGVDALKDYCTALAKYTLVDDRCGVHVHVGGLSKSLSPSFNKQFIMNAVNLGCYIEEELYKCMPKSRTPTLYHCHSIRRFGPVTKDNFADNIGAYIFGAKESWLTQEGNVRQRFFDFSEYTLGPNRNEKSNVGTWADGRYKWLNIIHAYLDTGHKTLEFRIFPGTVRSDKTYAYLMLALAFTWVCDNDPKIIKKGVTIADLFNSAFSGYEVIIQWLIDFYEERKKKFKRTTIYPAGPEVLKFLS